MKSNIYLVIVFMYGLTAIISFFVAFIIKLMSWALKYKKQ